jgi:hypothetical protein
MPTHRQSRSWLTGERRDMIHVLQTGSSGSSSSSLMCGLSRDSG